MKRKSVGLFTLSLLMLTVACKKESAADKITDADMKAIQTENAIAGKLAKVKFDKEVHDFGTIAEGAIVETDKYDRPINFPTCWLANNYDDMILAGTPIIQCIPFKRSTTIHDFEVRSFTESEFKKHEITRLKQDNQSSYYVNNLRVKK